MQLVQESPALSSEPSTKSMTVVVFSGDMDKLLAAFSLATSAAAMGVEVSLFFTFWGISALRKNHSYRGRGILHRMLNALLPSRSSRLPLSRKNMLGAGPIFFRHLMSKKNVANVHELVELAREAGVKLVACSMSMDVMGIDPSELIEGLEYGGAATCVKDLMRSETTLFI